MRTGRRSSYGRSLLEAVFAARDADRMQGLRAVAEGDDFSPVLPFPGDSNRQGDVEYAEALARAGNVVLRDQRFSGDYISQVSDADLPGHPPLSFSVTPHGEFLFRGVMQVATSEDSVPVALIPRATPDQPWRRLVCPIVYQQGSGFRQGALTLYSYPDESIGVLYFRCGNDGPPVSGTIHHIPLNGFSVPFGVTDPVTTTGDEE